MVFNTVFKIAAVLALTLISMDQAAAIPMASKAQLTGDGVEQKDCDTKGVRSQSTLGMLGGLIQKATLHSADGKDPLREQVRTGEGRFFAPIGVIKPNQKLDVLDAKGKPVKSKDVRGTTFLVSACYALTNAHAVVGLSKNPDAIKKKVSSTITFQAGNLKLEEKRATIAALGNKAKSGFTSDDWALVHLPSCPGEKIGWMKMAGPILDRHFEQSQFMIAGFPGDRSEDMLWAHKGCYANKPDPRNPGSWLSNCSSLGGMSGSPIMKITNGQPEVYGLLTSEVTGAKGVQTEWKADNSNVISDLRNMKNTVHDAIAPDLARVRENPAINPTIILGQK